MDGTSWFWNQFWCGSRLRGIVIVVFNPGDEITLILALEKHIIARAHVSYFVILSSELSLSKELQLEKESDLFSWTLKSKHDHRNTVQGLPRWQWSAQLLSFIFWFVPCVYTIFFIRDAEVWVTCHGPIAQLSGQCLCLYIWIWPGGKERWQDDSLLIVYLSIGQLMINNLL